MENRIDTIQDLEYYYQGWREDPTIVLRTLFTNKNYNPSIIDIIINEPQVAGKINYSELALDFIDEPVIYNWAVTSAEKIGQKLDVNVLAVQAAKENRLILVARLLQQGANNYQEILEGATTSFSVVNFDSLIERFKHETIDYYDLLLSATLSINIEILKYLIQYMTSQGMSIHFYKMIIDIMVTLDETPTPPEVQNFERWLINRSLDYKTLSIIYADLGRLDAIKQIFNTHIHTDTELMNIALIASKNGSMDIIQWVIEKDINKSLMYKKILKYAIIDGKNEISKYLIQYMIKIYNVYNILPIIFAMAVEKNNIEITKWMIDNHYNILMTASNLTKLILKVLEDNIDIDMVKQTIEYAIVKSYSFDLSGILLKAYEINNIDLVIWIVSLSIKNLSIQLNFRDLTKIVSGLIKNDRIELGMDIMYKIFQGDINIGYKRNNIINILNSLDTMIYSMIDEKNHIDIAKQIIDLAIAKKFPILLGYIAHHATIKNNIDLVIWLVNKAVDTNRPFTITGYIIKDLYKKQHIDVAEWIIELIISRRLKLPRDKDISDIVEAFKKEIDMTKLIWFINKVIELHIKLQIPLNNDFFTKIVNIYMKYSNIKAVEIVVNTAINNNLPIDLNGIIKFLILSNNLQGVELIDIIARNNNITLNINITESEMADYIHKYGYGERDTAIIRYVRNMLHTRLIQEEEGRQFKRQRNILTGQPEEITQEERYRLKRQNVPTEEDEEMNVEQQFKRQRNIEIEQPEEITQEERYRLKRQNVPTEEEEEMNVEQPEEMDIGQRFKKQKKRILF